MELDARFSLHAGLFMSRWSKTFQLALLALFVVFFVFWLHDPPYELHAMIHVVPTWVAVGILLASIRFFTLTNMSFAFIIVFFGLHVLGTRYIYSFVPYDQWSLQFFGATLSETLQLSRNHYDRVVHFSYGLLIAPVAREAVVRVVRVGSPWCYLAAVQFILASSVVFEFVEWVAAVRLAPAFADSYLGQQGDPWDAHMDMALAALGAVLSMLAAAIIWQLIPRQKQRDTRRRLPVQ